MKYGTNATFVLSDRHLRQGSGHASSAGSSQNTYKGAFRVGGTGIEMPLQFRHVFGRVPLTR